MSVHEQIKRQKIYKPNRHQGEVQNSENTDPQRVICPATVATLSVLSSTGFAESLKPLKTGH